MLSSIIFSRDRASQLHLLLDSLSKNFFLSGTNVIYKYTDEEHKLGYEMVQKSFPGYEGVNWVREEDFQKDTLDTVDKSENLVCFFTDDDIFYRPIHVDIDDIKELFDSVENIGCLSFRLGENTTIQDQYTGQVCVTPKKVAIYKDNFFVWDWKNYTGMLSNFYYPFSVDGHVYRKAEIQHLLSRYQFSNPNNLEGDGTNHTKVLPPYICCLQHSCVVNTPINIAGDSKNRAGEKFGISLKDMNRRYIDGETISLESIDFSNVVGCHQELEIFPNAN